jgi:L-2-hydroxyglutarate oxidase LhgO
VEFGAGALEEVVRRTVVRPDFLVLGAGVIGISVARELKRRYSDAKILVLEKEDGLGRHASGRNSGVLHAGFYYTAESLKARFTRDGNAELARYCDEHRIPLNRCGKLVVAQSEAEHESLDELMRRGRVNGVKLEEVDEKAVHEIEPRAITRGRALFSPTTASVDPSRVLSSMASQAVAEGIQIQYGVAYRGRADEDVLVSAGKYKPGYVVNAAGLYADQVARDFGFSCDYRILPFKGLYLYSNEPAGAIRTNIYPVPDLRHPFLGVHFTVTADSHVKIGPTAIPAFWREQYQGLDNFRPAELADVVLRQMGLMLSSGFDFMRLAWEEIRKYSRSRMVSLAGALARGVKLENYRTWGKPGIRAQLLNIKNKKLEMDFVFEGDNRSFHILNAVSPGFTCCLPFSRFVCDAIAAKLQ